MTPMSESQRHKLAAARLWAATKYPYLASALFAAETIIDDRVPGVAADRQWRIYLHPRVVDEWDANEIGREFVHHAGHLLRDHADRAMNAGIDEHTFADWVTAADCEVNDDLPHDDLALPQRPIQPRDIGCDDGRLAEEYFEAIRVLRREVSCDRDCGSASHGQTRNYEREAPGLGAQQRHLLRCGVACDVLEHGKQPGTVPAGLLRWAQQLVHGRIDWRRVLAAEIRRGINQAAGAVDYTYRRPSRRSHVMQGVVLPALRQPVPEVAVVCDTSGSMDDDLLATVLAEVDGLLRTVGVRGQSVRVLACDHAAHTAQRVRSASQVQLLGGGGTDMGAGITAATELRPRPSVIVVLTDGYTPWPASPPSFATVIVGLLGGPHAPEPPSWARIVRIDKS
jgi:predicted metal-dependent peptidase